MMMRCLTLAVFVAFAASCNRAPEQQQAERAEPMLLGPEDIARAEVGQVLTGALISGELQAQERATVRAQLSGSVTDVRAREGERVKEGERLARIRAVAEREAAASAKAAVQTAKTQLDAALRDQERTEVLVKAGALAQRDLDQARTTVAAARAQVAEAQARLAAASEQFAEAVVRAPISGVVSQAAVDSGDVVSVGAELFTIINPYTMELRASAPAENVSALRPGAPVQFDIQGYPGRTFRGTIRRVSPSVDPATRQVDVFASIPNDAGLLISGLYASGRIATGETNAIMVPEDAVKSVGGETYVLEVSGGIVERRDVTVGARDESTGKLEIESGLRPGDVVLVGPATEVRPGTPVQIQRGATAEPR